MEIIWLKVKLGGEAGHDDDLAHHLYVGLGEQQRVVQGDCWYTEDRDKANLYIFFNGVPIREHFNNIHNFLKIFTKQFYPNPFVQ
jgi:hypothetical protein